MSKETLEDNYPKLQHFKHECVLTRNRINGQNFFGNATFVLKYISFFCYIIAGSRGARNLFCRSYLDFGAKLFCKIDR